MKPTLNQEDIKLLKSIFATKEDLLSVKSDLLSMEKRQDKKYASKKDLVREIKKSERRIIKRMDTVDRFLDQEHTNLVRDVQNIKLHLRLPISSI